MIGKKVEKKAVDLMKKTIRTNSVLVSCSGCGKTVSRVETTQWVKQYPSLQLLAVAASCFAAGGCAGLVISQLIGG